MEGSVELFEMRCGARKCAPVLATRRPPVKCGDGAISAPAGALTRRGRRRPPRRPARCATRLGLKEKRTGAVDDGSNRQN